LGVALLNWSHFAFGFCCGIILTVAASVAGEALGFHQLAAFNVGLVGALMGATIGFFAQLLKIGIDGRTVQLARRRANSVTASVVQAKLMRAAGRAKYLVEHFEEARAKVSDADFLGVWPFAHGLGVELTNFDFSSEEVQLVLETLKGNDRFKFISLEDQHLVLKALLERYRSTRAEIHARLWLSDGTSMEAVDTSQIRISMHDPRDQAFVKKKSIEIDQTATTLLAGARDLVETCGSLLFEITSGLKSRDDLDLNFLTISRNEK
jgi:hypothetical protein